MSDVTWETALRAITKRQAVLESLIRTTRANLADLSSVVRALDACSGTVEHIKDAAVVAMCDVGSDDVPSGPKWYLDKVDAAIGSAFAEIDRLNDAVNQRIAEAAS